MCEKWHGHVFDLDSPQKNRPRDRAREHMMIKQGNGRQAFLDHVTPWQTMLKTSVITHIRAEGARENEAHESGTAGVRGHLSSNLRDSFLCGA